MVDLAARPPLNLRKLELLCTGAHLLPGILPGAFLTQLNDLPEETLDAANRCQDFYDDLFQQYGSGLEYLDISGVNKLFPAPHTYYPDLNNFRNLRTLVARFPLPDPGLFQYLLAVRQMRNLKCLVFHCRHSTHGETGNNLKRLSFTLTKVGAKCRLNELYCESLNLERFIAYGQQNGLPDAAVRLRNFVRNFRICGTQVIM